MSVQDLIKDISVADLTTFARYIPTPADFLLTQTVFAKVSVQDDMWRIKQTGRYVHAAKYRAFDASVPFADRQAWQTSTQGMLPSLGQKLMVGEVELLLQEAARGADASRLEQLLYDDVERHVEAVNSRLELAAGNVLVDGKFSLQGENGLTQEVDYGVPAANMPTAPKLWSDPTADMIADELRWIDYLDSIGAPTPEGVFTSRRVYSYLGGNNAYRAAYYGSVNPSTTPTATLTPQQVDVVRGNYSLPPIAQGQDIGEEFEHFGLVVGDAARQQPAAALVDRDAVVVGLACVDAGPDRGHVVPPYGVLQVPPDGRPRCRFPTERSFAIPNWQPSRRGASGGQSVEATSGRTLKATPDAPGWENHTRGSPCPGQQRREL